MGWQAGRQAEKRTAGRQGAVFSWPSRPMTGQIILITIACCVSDRMTGRGMWHHFYWSRAPDEHATFYTDNCIVLEQPWQEHATVICMLAFILEHHQLATGRYCTR